LNEEGKVAAPVISIIDDDKAVRDATQDFVRSLGYATNAFSSAEEYLQFGRVHGPSCLIADVRMPGMSGPELQDRLIAEKDFVPIIFMTAFPDENLRDKVCRAGACAFLTKPCDDNVLIGCLERALNDNFQRPGLPDA
jgi:FixJ family two-component response regulator